MRAFDFDGVIIPELRYLPGCTTAELESYQSKLRAIFQPTGEYIIITGRLEDQKAATDLWINENLVTKPVAVYYRSSIALTPEEHKASVINTQQISYFLESEIKQVIYLRKKTLASIKHIDQLLDK